MSFLYENFDTLEKFGAIRKNHFPCIEDNLIKKFPLRDYQEQAFSRFDYFFNADFDGKQLKPWHLLFNMATGSGKTLVMAGLMLYLYERGYRNFLFFVHSNNIIKKTKDNFLNELTSKYLFGNKITINGKEVYVKEVDTFESADPNNINIKFTTIQQLHIDLTTTKENSITLEDFKERKTVLIADEAHHLNSATANNGELFNTWEGSVLDVLNQNHDNLLLEFTATLNFSNAEISNKYQDKVIYKYDLAEFRKDRYSKEINLIRSEYDEEERVIQALILNLYRQELASENNVNLKPVILFKAKKTIAESKQHKENFHNLIERISATHIENIVSSSTVPIVQKALAYFNKKNVSTAEIARRIKSNFKFENCISANNDEEAELNQIRLNTLEDENNPIRAVFAVQKLNEGWDVLNLFDIVRLYDTRDGRAGQVGPTTLSEAQLIGRGARYFPFSLDDNQEKYTRKFDSDITNDLKVLEELYYHTKEDSRYISELKKALVASGVYEDDETLEAKKLILKPEFKKTQFYKTGRVFFNKKISKSYGNVKSFSDFGVVKRNFTYALASGVGRMSGAFNTNEEAVVDEIASIDMPISIIPSHITRFAFAQNPFFYFDNLNKYFPNIGALSNFIKSKEYFGGLEITFSGPKSRLDNITNADYLSSVQKLLQAVEVEIKSNLTEFEGSSYVSEYVHNVFKDKEIRVPKDSERANGQEELIKNEPWYVFNANYGTSEEKAFVKMFARRFKGLNESYENIYLVRNEREIKIFDKSGRAFEPDFILFCKQLKGDNLVYQVFIEPKGAHLVANDKWKEEFLKSIRDERMVIKFDTDKYLITGVPFYNNEHENEFSKALQDTLVG
jgi:type III restriction enzyme